MGETAILHVLTRVTIQQNTDPLESNKKTFSLLPYCYMSYVIALGMTCNRITVMT